MLSEFLTVYNGFEMDTKINNRGSSPSRLYHMETPSPTLSNCMDGHFEKALVDEPDSEELNRHSSSESPGAPPNGGLTAWLQVVGSFFLWFNTWGLINAFGAYQTFYAKSLLQDHSPSTIAWIGSVQSYLLLFVGVLTGPIFDAGYFRVLLLTGSFLMVFGLMMTSIASTFWQILLAQGFCVGIGAGCLFVPSLALVASYFTTKVPLATGLSATGSGIGGILYPIIFHKLQISIGFAWATRSIGFIVLATLLVPMTVMKLRVLPAHRRKLFDLSAWKEPAYVLYVLGSFLTFIGLWTPFYFIALYALHFNITSPNLTFYLLPIVASGSIFGRLIPNIFAMKYGKYNVLIPCATITGILAFCFIPIRSSGALIVVAVLYGFFSGASVSIGPLISVQLAPSQEVVGTWLGMASATIGLGLLVGTPVTGTLATSHGFKAAFAFSGAAPILGALVLMISRLIHSEWDIAKRV